MTRGTSKQPEESEPFSATGSGQQAKLTFWPVFSESNKRVSCCPTLRQAARVSHPKCVTWHLEHGDSLPQMLRHQHARVERPLHEAAGATPTHDGHRTPPCTLCVEMILGAGSQASWLDENGRSPLERAAMVGCVPCIETLLRSPARSTADGMDAICDQQSKALVEAARINSEASVRALLRPASGAAAPGTLLTSESRLGPALIESVKAGAYNCITPLVEAGAVLNPVGDAGSRRLAPLMIAAGGRKCTTGDERDDRAPDIIRLLVKLGAVVDTQHPPEGRSALHVSASKGRHDCMQALLELGANPTALDHDGGSPLHKAASSHHAEACLLLVNYITEASGAVTAVAALLAKDKRDDSPLYSAVSSCYWKSSPEMASCVSMLLRLLEVSGGAQAVAGALSETAGLCDRTILHSAAEHRHAHCLKALIEAPEGLRIALEVEDNDGKTPIALARQAGHDLDGIPAFAQIPFVPCCSGLVEAAEKGHVACVKHILKDGHPNMGAAGAAQGEGEFLDPLASVCHRSRGCSKIVRFLVEAGFHPDGRHGDFVPLENAAGDDRCIECTRLLIEAGAGGLFCSPEQSFFCPMWTILSDACGGCSESMKVAKSALAACDMRDDKHGVAKLCDWAGRQNTELPRLLVDAGADVAGKGWNGRTALHKAAGVLDLDEDGDYYDENDDEDGRKEVHDRDSNQHADLVGWLVSKGALLDARDNDGYTPMHIAASLGLSKVVAVLLDLGADPLLQSYIGTNSLHIAARAGCTTLMARFIDLGIDVNAKTDDGNTALHLASETGDSSCVRMLLDEGADPNKTNDIGWPPLRWAAASDNVKALTCLLDVGKGDLHQMIHGVGGLLHTAAYHGSTAVMQLLVNRGLDIAATILSNGETVMHHAAQNGGGLAVEWLLDNGASLDVQDLQSRTPQTYAVVKGICDEKVRSALEAIAKAEGGKRSTSGMSVVWDGQSLLHLAAAKGFEQCVRFLMSKGAGVDSETADGANQTAMHCAVSNASDSATSVVRALAESGASVDARDSSGRTPLHLAAAADDQLLVATVLLQHGALCDIADNNGRTPLWAAAKKGNLACCSLLVARGADMALRDIQGNSALGASLVGSRSARSNREDVMRLLIDLGCSVGESEVDAASRGGLTDSFAKAVTARMGGGTAARGLVKATFLTCVPAGGWASANDVVGEAPLDAVSAVSMMTVRVSSEPPPTFSSRRRRASSASSKEVISSKVYRVDRLRLRQAVSHLEGPDEVDKCLLLKLLLPPPAGWAAVYRGDSVERSSASSTSVADGQVERPGSMPSDAVVPSPVRHGTPCMSEVELSCNGDDFDEAGFEAVLEYLSTGQVFGATCGSIYGDVSASSNGATHKVGAHAVASHRAAAFFGLPRLQSMIRAWLKANGAEMEDDGTGVLAAPAEGSPGDVSKKRKFAGY